MNILMVCLGNICRSPLAEGILDDKARKARFNWKVESAGSSSHQEGCSPHALSQKIARLHGIDIGKQQCRQFIKEDMLRFDRIYVMDNEIYADVKRISGELWDASKTDLLMNEPYPGENIDIPDPWFGKEDGYHSVFEMIDKACDTIIKKYGDQKSKQKKTNNSAS